MTEPPLHAGREGPHAYPRKPGQARLDLVLAISAVFTSSVKTCPKPRVPFDPNGGR